MNYNFDELTDRHHTGSYKWDDSTPADVIPLWVADMDFRTAPAVQKAVCNRAASGIYGYVSVPDSYYQALHDWFENRHGWRINTDMVIYTSGVVPALSAIIKALVQPGEKVILQTPAYNCFFSCVRNNKAVIVENPLIRINKSDGFTYEINFKHLEELCSDPHVKILILCNPQNPTGRVWTRKELEQIRDICRLHNVRVISDEIHCELIHPGFEYIPYATIDDQAIVCCSPSKAFNTAGLQIANIICPDAEVRAKVDRAINDNEVCDVNPFGVAALEAAYTQGADWLDNLNQYLWENYCLLRDMFTTELPQFPICNSESTYLAWLDISSCGLTADELSARLLNDGRVRVSPGSIYAGEGYIRINYATPRARLKEGLHRIIKVLKKDS